MALFNNKKQDSEKKLSEQDYVTDVKLRETVDFYFTDQGYKCFTERFHLKRGQCCQSSCRHCPYGYNKKTNSLK